MTRTVIQGGQVFDSTDGSASVADVVIEGDRVVDVGTSLDGDEAIDATGHAVYPGFIDCHVHFMVDGDLDPMSSVHTPFSLNFYLAAERMARTLGVGVTTVREAGGSDLGMKTAQQRGFAPGPDMQISITILSQTGGHGDSWEPCGAHMPSIIGIHHPGKPHNIVDGPEEMRKKVRELIRAGADVIKVCTSGGVLSPRDDPRHGHYRDDELDVLVAEASAAFYIARNEGNWRVLLGCLRQRDGPSWQAYEQPCESSCGPSYERQSCERPASWQQRDEPGPSSLCASQLS